MDGSIKKLVDTALAKMEERADVLGEELTRNLIGCRKIKFRKIGIRIVYRIVGDKAEIAEIITIGKLKDNEVNKITDKRLETLKKLKEEWNIPAMRVSFFL
ncbi:addiction module toxin RelE [Lederbergia sp. NSJ-179]|uniref:addiction module toxin RelE n=1 Tax=Lederbergia sp. NSJ-179 TaxID=2931402 RepID=UPI001FD44202|nr:addiction module toxin RelE [Lederbergia sp. NSJ-179]MCJ7842213.1 addiction module toxin RelE [Lederbergia sp. NSJ-179]